jgi:hypothetical protein
MFLQVGDERSVESIGNKRFMRKIQVRNDLAALDAGQMAYGSILAPIWSALPLEREHKRGPADAQGLFNCLLT